MGTTIAEELEWERRKLFGEYRMAVYRDWLREKFAERVEHGREYYYSEWQSFYENCNERPSFAQWYQDTREGDYRIWAHDHDAELWQEFTEFEDVDWFVYRQWLDEKDKEYQRIHAQTFDEWLLPQVLKRLYPKGGERKHAT